MAVVFMNVLGVGEKGGMWEGGLDPIVAESRLKFLEAVFDPGVGGLDP